MSDVKVFIDTVGQDVTAVAVPKIETIAAAITTRP